MGDLKFDLLTMASIDNHVEASIDIMLDHNFFPLINCWQWQT